MLTFSAETRRFLECYVFFLLIIFLKVHETAYLFRGILFPRLEVIDQTCFWRNRLIRRSFRANVVQVSQQQGRA